MLSAKNAKKYTGSTVIRLLYTHGKTIIVAKWILKAFFKIISETSKLVCVSIMKFYQFNALSEISMAVIHLIFPSMDLFLNVNKSHCCRWLVHCFYNIERTYWNNTHLSGCEATIVLNERTRIYYNCSTDPCAKNWIHHLWIMGPSQSKYLNRNSTVTVFIQKWNVCRFLINIKGNFISFGGCLTLTF